LQGRGGVNGYSADEERVAAAKPPKRAGASSQNVRSCKKLNANIDEKGKDPLEFSLFPAYF